MIVARDPGSAKKATSYAERLRLGIAVIHGEQKEVNQIQQLLKQSFLIVYRTSSIQAESDMVDGRHSPPLRSRTMDAAGGMPVLTAKEKPPINVVGDVGGRIAIMVVGLLLPRITLEMLLDYETETVV